MLSKRQSEGNTCPNSKVHGANMGPTWVLSSPGGPHCWPHGPYYLGQLSFRFARCLSMVQRRRGWHSVGLAKHRRLLIRSWYDGIVGLRSVTGIGIIRNKFGLYIKYRTKAIVCNLSIFCSSYTSPTTSQMVPAMICINFVNQQCMGDW